MVPTLTAALQRNADIYRDNIAILDREVSYTWSQYIDRVARAAGMLRDLGIDRGDRYAILALNSWRQAELIYAGHWLGAIPVPINFRLAAPEISEILEDARCKSVAIGPEFVQILDAPELRAWRNRCFYLCSRHEKHNPDYDSLIKSALPLDPANTLQDDEAILLYTGGTTGKSKGVPLTHDNILNNAMQIGSIWPASSKDVVLHLPPMFHSAELVKTVYMLNGASNVYLPKFEPEILLQTIEEFRVSFVLMVPTIIMVVLESGLTDEYDLGSLKQIIYGASPMPASWIKKTMETFPGVQIAQGYGLTETSPLITMLDHESHVHALNSGNQERLSSCGRPLSGVEVRIVDEQDRVLSSGEEGEITVRGRNVFNGYLGGPDLNKDVLKEGWFYTGDVGYMDENGYLHLKDRLHDVIMTGGEKVYSSEVEAVIYQHPEVAECAVIGLPDRQYGEKVHAVVIRSPGSQLTEAELVAHCREQIGAYKIPRKIFMVEQLPKSAMGKILKTELRLQYDNKTEPDK